MRRRKEDALETRERILDAAITVFHQQGVARPSLTEVAELAGVTRGAIYGHFRNKADLFNALAERVQLPGEQLCEGAGASDDPCLNPLGILRTRWLWLFQEVASNRQWQQILDIIMHRCELVTESGEIRQRMLDCRQDAVARMRQLLSDAVAREQLPADLDVHLAATILHGAFLGLLDDWLLQPDERDLAQLGERCMDTLIEMLMYSPSLRLPKVAQ
ncbi:TetR family transcriptional regulator [Microbulbifer aestuariivivens]|uniref:TetR family transcriptional regulator n=1 Tax=Microbulbifer aestuariivivens TaxID=1908308 RepID=UPI0031E6F78B